MSTPPVARWLPLALVTLGAFWLRTHDIARRPMHADEANQAVKFGELLEHGRYAFDPRDHHGPTLYYAALPLAWLRGETTLATLTETTVRLVPALAGTIAVVILAALALPLGRWPALAAAAFLAVSPTAVYYSRYFIQETLLFTFTLGMLASAQCWWRSGRVWWALAAGVCAGLMQATKASAPLFSVAAGLALFAARPGPPASLRPLRDAVVAAIAALIVAMLFYSSFGRHFAGLRDAIATYTQASHRVTEAGRFAQPWWYYLRLFGWRSEGGVVTEQIAFSILAIAGVAVAFVRGNKLLRWSGAYTAVVVIAFSLLPYKTPWNAIHFVSGFSLLAAGAVASMPFRSVAVALTAGTLAIQTGQTWQAAFTRPADERNPYAYVQSSPDVLKFRALADTALAHDPEGVVRVISEEYWPLPWYFRGLARVGYWSSPPQRCDGALVIASANLAETVRDRLHGTYAESILGIRPGALCVIFTPAP